MYLMTELECQPWSFDIYDNIPTNLEGAKQNSDNSKSINRVPLIC